MSEFPARIHVLFASQAPIGLVFRRGPSKHVATILWDRRRDTFELGQWLKGRIYERRSDLSSDGKRLIYFAMNGKWQSESKGSWTAISNAPYLKAIEFYPKGDCWQGGGLWTNMNTYWLNDGYGHAQLQDSDEVSRDRTYSPEHRFGAECLSVYYPRLMRDGWTLSDHLDISKWQQLDMFDKSLDHGWLLRKIVHSEIGSTQGKGCYWDEHQLIHARSGVERSFPDWEWAELDCDRERLVWAAAGKIFSGNVLADGLAGEKVLVDLNPMKFTAVEAPY